MMYFLVSGSGGSDDFAEDGISIKGTQRIGKPAACIMVAISMLDPPSA